LRQLNELGLDLRAGILEGEEVKHLKQKDEGGKIRSLALSKITYSSNETQNKERVERERGAKKENEEHRVVRM